MVEYYISGNIKVLFHSNNFVVSFSCEGGVDT